MTSDFEQSIPPQTRFTRKEKELFDALAENANQILSRSYLLRNVWGYSDEAQTRTVDVHIRRLRKKLEKSPSLKIYTVFGKGYVMDTRPPGDSVSAEAQPGLFVAS